MIVLWLTAGLLASSEAVEQPSTNKSGDGGHSKRPIVQYRPKVETRLEEVLEAIEDAPIKERTSVKRKIVKDAREAVRALETTADFKPALQAIETALSALARAAGEYEAFQDAAMRVAVQIEALIADMEAKRKKRRQEEEMVIQWLLN